MNRNIFLGITSLILLVIAVAIGYILTKDSEKEESSNSNDTFEMATAEASDTQENIALEEGDNSSAGSFTNYSEELLANAVNGNVVLFFHADWCPTCLALERDIERNLDEIPSDLTILKTEYGNTGETELAQKYNVLIQHTLIQVDENGNELKRWAGSPRLSDVVIEVI